MEALIQRAQIAREFSYSPYSGYMVGAALLTKEGEVITGCNIENAAYGPTNCAERTAFFKAISEGKFGFEAIAIVGGAKDAKERDMSFPCGVCRQVMREFCDPKEFLVIVARSVSEYQLFTLEELLPQGFGPENLKG